MPNERIPIAIIMLFSIFAEWNDIELVADPETAIREVKDKRPKRLEM